MPTQNCIEEINQDKPAIAGYSVALRGTMARGWHSDAPGLDRNTSLQTTTAFFHRAFTMANRLEFSLNPCHIESNALRLLAPPWLSSAAVLSIRMRGRGMTAATTDMATDLRWFNPTCRLALAAHTARRITTSVVATAQAITANLTGTHTSARTTARIPGPAKEDSITRHHKEAHREAHREAHLAAPFMAARRAGAPVVLRRRRPATMAGSTEGATVEAAAEGPVVETTVRPAMATPTATASIPTGIDPARIGLSHTA
jgi:hypothetical protein